MNSSILNSKIKKDYAKKLLMNKYIPNEVIPIILQNTEKKNAKIIKIVIKDKEFDYNLLPTILKSTSSKNNYFVNNKKNIISSRIKFAETLINNKHFPNNCIWDILYYYGTNKTNNEFIEKLCNNKNFPPQQISSLLESFTTVKKWWRQTKVWISRDKYKQNLTKKLTNDPKCPNEYIADIINSINSGQRKLFEQIYKDNNIQKSKIPNILYIDYGLKKWSNKLKFSEKITILTNSVSIKDPLLKYLKKYNIDIKKVDNLVDKISKDIWIKENNIQTEKIYKNLLLKNIISNDCLTENKIKQINLDNYKNWIPLKYPREIFLKDIEKIITWLNKHDKTNILNYFNLNIENWKIEGIPTISKTTIIKKEHITQIKKIKEKIDFFTKKNESKISNPKTKKFFDIIIKWCPEFSTIIGKKQSTLHKYTIDIHTLKVLQNALNDKEYNKLDDESKIVLKFSILLHDFGKKEGIIDKKHPETSAKIATWILSKYNIPNHIKNRIIEIIHNHHRFEKYNKNKISTNYVNTIFRTPKDILIAKIMTKADLAWINDEIFDIIRQLNNEFNEDFNNKRTKLIKKQNIRYENINLVTNTKFHKTHNRKFPYQDTTINNKKYKIPVLNLTDNKLQKDLYKIWFDNHINKEDIRLFAHFNNKIKNLKIFIALSSSPIAKSIQSLSLISYKKCKTYKNQIYWVVTDIDMANIAQASTTDIASGHKKDFKNFSKSLFSFWRTNTYVKDNFLHELKKYGIKLTKNEYMQLSKQIVDKQYKRGLHDNIQINNKIIKTEIIENALNASRDKLLEGKYHNEIIAINPKVTALIARVSSIKECNQDFIKLSINNNLPIILIGNNWVKS